MSGAARVELLGRTFDVAPYKIADLRQAAPIVDKINASIGALTTLAGGNEFAGDLIAFVAIGLHKLDPAITAASLEEQLGLEDTPALQAAFTTILSASGFKLGEAKAPPPAAPAEA